MKQVKKNVLLALGGTLFVAAFLHGWNMFHYPYYEGDEGIYVSQAWSVIKEGSLSPYTYWYDHPPLGWITMSLWGAVFGGNFFIFGESSIDNMRVFMLIVHIISASLVFFIARRITDNTKIAIFATLFFTLSPIFIYYQRRVLLDNVLTLWLLASVAILYIKNLRLWHIGLSGAFFGCALLTKIPAIVFLPGILYVLVQQKCSMNFLRRATLWLAAAFCIGMIFITYTIAKGEFLPPSITGKDNVSFISGIQFQLNRDSTHSLLHPESAFRLALNDWILKDIPTIIVATVGILIGIVAMFKNTPVRTMMIFVLIYLAFLMRGGIVTNFHILPLVPFLAIACAIAFWWLIARFQKDYAKQSLIYIIFSVVLLGGLFTTSKKDYLHADETSNYNKAITWIKENIDEDKSVIADIQGLVDLRDPRHINEKTFERADWFSKVFHDGLIRDYKYEGNAQNIDYMLLSHEHLRQLGGIGEDNIAKIAYQNAAPIKDWTSGAGHMNESRFGSQVGNWAKLYKTDEEQKRKIEELWRAYKDRYIFSYGRVASKQEGRTTPEDQANAMHLAILLHDQATFDQIWQWTKDHLQYRHDRLFSREWVNDKRTEDGNLTRADATFAAALFLGYESWGDEKYRVAGEEIIKDLWEHAIIQSEDTYTVLPTEKGAGVFSKDHYAFDYTALTPSWYEIFARYSENTWEELAQATREQMQSIEINTEGENTIQWQWQEKESRTREPKTAREGGDELDTLEDKEAYYWFLILEEDNFEKGEMRNKVQKIIRSWQGTEENKKNRENPAIQAVLAKNKGASARKELAQEITQSFTEENTAMWKEDVTHKRAMQALLALTILDDTQTLEQWQKKKGE